MIKRRPESSPHFDESQKPSAEFGNPESIEAHFKPKRSRRNVPVPGARRIFTQESVPISTAAVERGKREWEEFVLDEGEVKISYLGRSYTIGVDHPSVDVWNAPSGDWQARRLDAVRGCTFFVLKKDNKSSKSQKDEDQQNPAWVQALVFKGVSGPLIRERLLKFSDNYGDRKIVSAEWSQIRSTGK